MTVADLVHDAEHELDQCRVAEQHAHVLCRTARSSAATAARRDLRATQSATVAAERALAAALSEGGA